MDSLAYYNQLNGFNHGVSGHNFNRGVVGGFNHGVGFNNFEYGPATVVNANLFLNRAAVVNPFLHPAHLFNS